MCKVCTQQHKLLLVRSKWRAMEKGKNQGHGKEEDRRWGKMMMEVLEGIEKSITLTT